MCVVRGAGRGRKHRVIRLQHTKAKLRANDLFFSFFFYPSVCDMRDPARSRSRPERQQSHGLLASIASTTPLPA